MFRICSTFFFRHQKKFGLEKKSPIFFFGHFFFRFEFFFGQLFFLTEFFFVPEKFHPFLKPICFRLTIFSADFFSSPKFFRKNFVFGLEKIRQILFFEKKVAEKKIRPFFYNRPTKIYQFFFDQLFFFDPKIQESIKQQ